jgi:hypothetical protein
MGWYPRGTVTKESNVGECEVAIQLYSNFVSDILISSLKERSIRGNTTIVEGSFNTQSSRNPLYEMVSLGLLEELVFVHCITSIEENRDRIRHRKILVHHKKMSNDQVTDPETVNNYRMSYEPICEDQRMNSSKVSIINYQTDNQIVTHERMPFSSLTDEVSQILLTFANCMIKYQ